MPDLPLKIRQNDKYVTTKTTIQEQTKHDQHISHCVSKFAMLQRKI